MKITDDMLYQHTPIAERIWLDSLPDDNLLVHHFSERFERKMRKLIKQQRHTPAYNQTVLIAKRVAVIVLISTMVVFSSLMTAEAYREKAIEIITQVFHEFTDYHFVSSSANEILPSVAFGYVPEGMRQTECEIDDTLGYFIYEADDGTYFELRQHLVTPDSNYGKRVDTEDAEIERFDINGDEAVSMTKYGETTMIWSNHNTVYTLYSNMELSELQEIARQLEIE